MKVRATTEGCFKTLQATLEMCVTSFAFELNAKWGKQGRQDQEVNLTAQSLTPKGNHYRLLFNEMFLVISAH